MAWTCPTAAASRGGVFVVQLLLRSRSIADVALILVEDRQFQRDLRPEVADVGVVAASR